MQQEVEQSGEAFYNALMRKFQSLGDLAEQAEIRLSTQWSTFQGNLELALADLGSGLEKAVAQLVSKVNTAMKQLLEERVFERLGWTLGVLVQAMIAGISSWIEEARGFVGRVISIVGAVVGALRAAIDNALNRLGVVGDWIRAGGNWTAQRVSAVWSLTPWGRWMEVGAEVGQGLRAVWDLSAIAIRAQGGVEDFRAERRTPTWLAEPSKSSARQAERERNRLARERQEAERIVRDLATQNARAAWDALYGILDAQNAIWVAPLMEALENQIAAEEAGKVLARIEANTSQSLRDALARQAWEIQRRTRDELVGRRVNAVMMAQEREADAARRTAERRQEMQRAGLRALYGALGMEDALLQMNYADRMAFYQEAGFGLLAPVLAGMEVYVPVQQRRQTEQRQAQERFMEALRERGEAARAARQRALERQLRRGLISPMTFVSELRRMYQTQPIPEGALSAFESGLMDEVQAQLPKQELFESAQAYRDRWLQALQDLKTAYGEWLQNLLHPEQFGQVMESFEALALQFEQRFIERVESRWKRFVQSLAENLESGIGNAMVNALERVLRNVRSAGDAVRDLFSSILAMIRQTIAQILYERVFKQLVEHLVETILSAVGARGGGGGGGITLGGVLMSIGVGLVTSWLGGIFGLQSGGRAGAGRAYLVGERGAEVFVPQTDGVVYPHTYLRKMVQPASSLGGASITVYVNDTGDVDLARRIARALERLR